jgi:hypothetical protein
VVALWGLSPRRLPQIMNSGTIVHAQQPAVAHTPGNNRAYIFAPFDFDPSFHADYQPAEDALKEEGYNLKDHIFKRTSLQDPHPTIQDFLLSSGAGVLIISSHGLCCEGSGFAIEVFADDRNHEKAKHARDSLIAAEVPEGAKAWKAEDFHIGDFQVNTGTAQAPSNRLVSALSITGQGIRDHWKGDQSFVYLAACCAAKTETAFKAVGADVVFGYQKEVPSIRSARSDFKALWTRLDGTRDKGAPMGKPLRRTYNAYQDCCDPVLNHRREEDLPSMTKEPQIVLAPSVETRVPNGPIKLLSGLPETLVSVELQFNAKMEKLPPKGVTRAPHFRSPGAVQRRSVILSGKATTSSRASGM